MDVAISMLGRFAVAVDGSELDHAEWRRRHAAALVKILALAGGRSMHREQVMDLLWPDLSIESAAPRLHKAAHYARRVMGAADALVLAGESVALFPQRDVWVDAAEFERLAAHALSTGDPIAAARAAEAYAGEFLPQDRYESWALETRERLHLRYLDILRLAGRWDLVTALEPTDEDAHLRLIADLAGRGQRPAALRQFERLERALRQELGVALSAPAIKLRAELRAEETEMPSVSAETGLLELAGLSPFQLVGRADERVRLLRLLDDVQRGAGHVLYVGGSAGVGKSALLTWLTQAAGDRRLRVGRGAAAHVEGAWPYAPVLEAIADLCRRHPTLLDGLDDALKSEIESGLSGREVAWTSQSGHQRLFVAVAELLRLAASGDGALLVIDDAHQADDASLRLLHYLARATQSDRVLLVLGHRPSVDTGFAYMRQSLDSQGAAVALDVGAMNHQEVADLTRRLVPTATDEFVGAVWGASQGFPFAVVELTRAEGGAGSLTPRGWIPAALTAPQRAACAAAAVLGNAFDTDEFVHVTGLAEDEAYAVLEAALAHRLLLRTDTGYEFRHSILRESLLAELRPSQLRLLHLNAAKALQALDRSPGRVGHHLLAGGAEAAAVPWMLRAAESSAALGANQEALATLQVIRGGARGSDVTRLLALRAELLMASADAGAVDAYREALAETTEPAQRSRLRARLARAATFAGDLGTAEVALDGLVLDGTAADADLLLVRGHVALFKGDLAVAEAAAAEARRRVTLDRPQEWQAFELIGLQGLLAHNKGQWFQQLRLELSAGVKMPALAARIFDSHLCVAEFLLYGPTPYPEVLALAAELRTTAERSGVLRAVAFAVALRGETALLMGDLPLAEVELREAANLHHDIGSSAGEAHSLQRLAEVKLALGDRVEANRLLQHALPLARFSNIGQHLLQRVYGTMIDAAPDPSAARALVDHAEASLGVNDRCAFCMIMLAIPSAHACAEVGDVDAALRYLQAAEESEVRWEGTAWQASILDVKGHLAASEGDLERARLLRLSAAELFETSGQPLDAARSRAAAARIPGQGPD